MELTKQEIELIIKLINERVKTLSYYQELTEEEKEEKTNIIKLINKIINITDKYI